MKKFVLRLELSDSNDKRKALKTIAALPGIDEITMDMNSKQVTVIGNVDPVTVVSKLRKHWTTGIISVGPAKEPEKKEEPKKEEAKKEEEKKGEEKKEEGKKEEEKKEEGKKEEGKKAEAQPVMIMPYRQYYYPPMNSSYYNYGHHHSIEENPNACVIS